MSKRPAQIRDEAAQGGEAPIQGTQVLGRAIDVLKTVARLQRPGATLAAITHATGLSRSTAFRIVHFLNNEKMLAYDEAQGTYHIGALAYELGLAARDNAGIAQRWRDRIERISRHTGMTTYLTARSDLEVVCLAVAEGQTVVRTVSLVPGERLPLGVGAGSLAILASLGDEDAKAAVEANAARLRRFPGSRLTAEVLWERIALARAEGYAYSEGSVAAGVAGVGVTVMGEHDFTQLAVSVSSTPPDFDLPRRRKIARHIEQVAQTG